MGRADRYKIRRTSLTHVFKVKVKVKVRVIETSMRIYIMHKSIVMRNLSERDGHSVLEQFLK